MSSICSALVILLTFAIPILLVIFLVKWIRKKPKKKIGIAILLCTVGFVVSSLVGAYSWLNDMTPEERAAYDAKQQLKAEQREAEKEKKRLEKETEMETDQNTRTKAKPTVPVEAELDKTESVRGDIYEKLVEDGYTAENSAKIQEVLNMVGIERIEIENMTGEPESGLNTVVFYPNGETEENRRALFTSDNGEIFYVGFLDEDLYDKDNGGYLKSYNDVHIPEAEVSYEAETVLMMIAEDVAKSVANNPSTVDFKTMLWGFKREDDKYTVSGTFECANSFGVEEEHEITVACIAEDGKMKAREVWLDGVKIK